MKKCKQCGESLSEAMFRPYYPRGKGIRKSKVGCNTICISCERINNSITKAWKADPKTVKDLEVLAQAIEYYDTLIANGLEPIGAFAASRRGSVPARQRGTEYTQAKMAESIKKLTVNVLNIDDELDKFVDMKFTEHPSVYDAMYETIRTKCLNNEGQVVAQYKEKLGIAADKQMNYEETWN